MKKELSIDELMKIAKNPVKEDDNNKHLSLTKRFIMANNLKDFPTADVPAYMIFYRYLHWANINNIKPDSDSTFFKEFKLFFKSRIKTNGVYYYISPEGFDLSIENKEILREKWNSRGKNKKEKNQKSKKTSF